MNLLNIHAICFLFILLCPLLRAQKMTPTYFEEESIPREHALDILHVKLNVRFEPEQGLVNGVVTHYFRTLQEKVDSIFFDGPGIEIIQVTLGNRPTRFKTTTQGVIVYPNPSLQWGNQDSITFHYKARPRKGIYFIGWKDKKGISRKQIWTQGQGIDHRYWIPCYDDANDKVITETIVTFDKKYKVLSNGTRLGVRDNHDGTRTWHYKMQKPHSLYLLMLAIGEYEVKTITTKNNIPIHLWYYPDWESRFETTYRYSKEAVEFMEEHTGIPFPWESYSQVPVQDFIYGAMENTTATIFGDFFCVDTRDFLDRNYINVNVHELTHQWFGDLITHRSPSHIWLHESFATFYPKLFTRKYFGESHYQWQRRGEQNSALEASKTDNYPIASTKGGVARFYAKGSAVLDMMIYTFGEEAYRKVIQYYLKKHAYKNVETNDLFQAFQDTLGISPYWFFDQWIYRGGEPHYQVSYSPMNIQGQAITRVTVQQIHPTNEMVRLFKMPIVIEVYYQDGSSNSVRFMIQKQTEQIDIPNPQQKEISFVLFDPGSYVLKNITFKKSLKEIAAQLQGAKNMIDRYDALVMLRDTALEKKRDLLIRAFEREHFHAMRSEIVTQLINDNDPASIELIRKAIQAPQHEVRQTVIMQTKQITEQQRPYYESLLKDSSYTTVQEALDKLCDQFPQHCSRYLQITQRDSGQANRVKIKWLEIAAMRGSKKAYADLKLLASNSYEFRTRQNAIQALKRLNYLDQEYLPYLIDAYISPNRRLGGVAETALQYYLQQNQYRKIILQFYNAHREEWNKEELELLKILIK
ncbi:MAG: M1 family metallopeptidase [Bacteroidia bacterium]|nr:M1 family metallopeptidase [Bacteroidia bacterium]MDW8158275.1 M1 family metallopeptidase [Bacteroidia bacterium]